MHGSQKGSGGALVNSTLIVIDSRKLSTSAPPAIRVTFPVPEVISIGPNIHEASGVAVIITLSPYLIVIENVDVPEPVEPLPSPVAVAVTEPVQGPEKVIVTVIGGITKRSEYPYCFSLFELP